MPNQKSTCPSSGRFGIIRISTSVCPDFAGFGMYPRSITPQLQDLAKAYPVVTVLGPRQSGKTTLVRHAFPNKPYVNFELPEVQDFVREDPKRFLEMHSSGAILDEVQRVPKILSYIQVMVDEREEKGIFILTSSHQLEVHPAVSQSLAGRTVLLNLLPLSVEEITQAGFTLSLDELLFHGGYPQIYQEHLDPSQVYRSYFQTYVERDLRLLLQVKDLSQFQKFMRVCAARIGQLLNLEGIGHDIGVSFHTIKEWISILEASFVVFRIQPYYDNFGKRITKASKLYFTDVGLAAYLLGIQDVEQISHHVMRGSLFENLVILELMKSRFNRGLDPQLYYFRDAHGHEVDLLFQRGDTLVPIEIKSSSTFHADFLKNIRFFHQLVGEKSRKGFVIYGGNQEQAIGADLHVLPYAHAAKSLL